MFSFFCFLPEGRYPLQKCSDFGGLNVWISGVMLVVLNIVLLQNILPCTPLPRGRRVCACPAVSVPWFECAVVAEDSSRGGAVS